MTSIDQAPRMVQYEYRVSENRLKSPADVEALLNSMSADGWEYIGNSTLGPIPSLWLYFRREKE